MHPVHICTCVVLLVVIASTASQEAITIHITGPVRVIISGRHGNCFNGTTQEEHGSQVDVVGPEHPQGCPDGFVNSTGSAQCFKMFKDKTRKWEDAKMKCESEGLHLAEPSSDDVAVALRKDLLDTYGDSWMAWLGALADGSKWMWQRGNGTLSIRNPLWLHWVTRQPDTGRCLVLMVDTESWSRQPGQPYAATPCRNNYGGYAVCEV